MIPAKPGSQPDRALRIPDLLCIIAYVSGMYALFHFDIISDFRDRDRNIAYFNGDYTILDYVPFEEPLDYLLNEWLWHKGVTLLIEAGLSVESILNAIAVLCLTAFGWFVAKRHGGWAVILLVNPLIVDLVVSQSRSAWAFATLLIGYLSKNRKVLILCGATSLLIHTAMTLVAGVGVVAWQHSRVVSRLGPTYVSYLLLVGFGVALAVVLGPLRDQILTALGDRRAGDPDGASSILYLSYWAGLLLLGFVQEKAYYADPVHAYAIIMLAIVTAAIFTNSYAIRFIALSIPIFVSASLGMERRSRFLAIYSLLPYTWSQWVYRLT